MCNGSLFCLGLLKNDASFIMRLLKNLLTFDLPIRGVCGINFEKFRNSTVLSRQDITVIIQINRVY